jgi:hypothetical protein
LAGSPLVLKAVALAGDLHDVRVVEQSIKQSRGERRVVGEGVAHCVSGRLLVRIMLPCS